MGETQKRAAILAAASQLFAEKGYADTPTSEIAREAGVAEGTLYHHFGSKDGIFLTIFDETVDGYLAGVDERVREGQTGGETLQSLIAFHFDYLGRHTRQFLIILRDFPEHLGRERAGGARRRKFARLTDLLSEILSRGASDGSIALRFPARDTAEMLRGILYGTTRHRMLGIIDVPLSRLAAMVGDFCRQALSPPPEAAERQGGGKR